MNRLLRIAVAPISLLAALAASLGVPAMAATAFPDFPRSSGVADIGRWLASQTDLPLSSVVLVGSGYVFSFQAPDPGAQTGGLVWRQVREEVTSLGMASRLSGRSASATIAFDCQHNQATASDVIVYAGNSLQGGPGQGVAAADWLVANPGLYLMDLARAACDASFRRPFAQPPGSALAATTAQPEIPASHAPRPEAGAEHWVQVGAFVNGAAANLRWREIQRLLPSLSAGRGIRIEPSGHPGKALVRALIGPFHGAAPARAFCLALKAKGGDCLVR